jgi:hypothetical protein
LAAIEKRRSSAALLNVAASSTRISRLAIWSALAVIANFVRNLFARQSRFHLIKLEKTIALHAYATII